MCSAAGATGGPEVWVDSPRPEDAVLPGVKGEKVTGMNHLAGPRRKPGGSARSRTG